MHQRKLIRDKIVSLLVDKTDAGANVFPSRKRPVEEQILPTIQVYANSESVEIWQEAPREYERRLSISVEITAKENDDLDVTLDTIAEDVEAQLTQDHTLGELCRDIILTGTDITINDNGDTLIGSCKITYDVLYYTLAVADMIEENGFGPFEKVDIKTKMPSTPVGQIDSEDEIDLPQPP